MASRIKSKCLMERGGIVWNGWGGAMEKGWKSDCVKEERSSGGIYLCMFIFENVCFIQI